MGDTLQIFGKTWTNVAGFKATDDNDTIQTYEKGGGGYSIEDYILRTPVTGDITVNTVQARTNNSLAYTNITSISAPNLTDPKGNFSSDCPNLERASFPSITNNSCSYLVYSCPSLTDLDLPNLAAGSLSYMARFCTSLEYVVLPKFAGTINSNNFRNCTKLKAVDCMATAINNQNNFDTSALDTLILRGSLCTLAGTNSFNSSPFASGGTGGTLYVPASLVSDYTSATNWSTILGYTNNQIKSIESTHTDPNAPIDLTLYYADGTLIPTT